MSADGGPILGAIVDDKPIRTERYRVASRRWSLSYTAPSDSGFTLVLTMPRSSRPTLGILSQRLGLPPLPDVHLSGRPPGIVPVQGGDVTLVYYRIRL